MKDDILATRCDRALQKLAKWRTLLTGWQLGTRPKGDPEGDAVRDQRESLLLMRVEVNALAHLLLSKKVFTQQEFQQTLITECEAMQKMLEDRFPGVHAEDYGLLMDPEIVKTTMKGWKP